jgi:hypothetical protein
MRMYFLVFEGPQVIFTNVYSCSFSSNFLPEGLDIGVFWTLDVSSILLVGLIFLSHDTTYKAQQQHSDVLHPVLFCQGWLEAPVKS